MICRMEFDIFFGILIFDPKGGFCKGKSAVVYARTCFVQYFKVFLRQETVNVLLLVLSGI